MPRPPSVIVSPGCVPALTSTGTGPSSVGTSIVVPSAASGAGDVDDGDEVAAVAQEALVLGDAHDDVEVAVRAAALARVPAGRDVDPLAVGDAGRHADLARACARRSCRRRGTPRTARAGCGRRRRRCRRWPSGRAGRTRCARRPGAGPSPGSAGTSRSACRAWRRCRGRCGSARGRRRRPRPACRARPPRARSARRPPRRRPAPARRAHAPPPNAASKPPAPKKAEKRSEIDPKSPKFGA